MIRKSLLAAGFLLGSAACASAQFVGSGTAGYPPGSTPVAVFTTQADTTTVGISIGGTAGQYTYICGFEINGLGATAATTVTPTLSGVSGGTPTFQGQYTFPLGAAVVATPFTRSWSGNCLRTLNTGNQITINVPGAAGNTATNVSIWGYTQ